MARVKFGDYIRQIDYLGAQENYEDSDDDPSNKLIHYEKECDKDQGFSFSEIQDAYAAFREKVAIPDFPGRHSPAYWVANATACVIGRLESEFQDDKEKQNMIGKENVYTRLALLRARPGSSHLELMSHFCGTLFEEYLQNSSDDEICSILKQMQIKFGYHASEIEDEQTYSSLLRGGVNGFICALTKETCARPAVHGELTNLYQYYEQQLPSLPSRVARYIGYVLTALKKRLPGQKLYGPKSAPLDMSDVKALRSHLEALQKTVSTYEGDMNDIKCDKTLHDILTSTVKQNLVKDIFGHVMTLITMYSNRKTPMENGEEIYWVYRAYLFADLTEDSTKADDMFAPCIQMMSSLLAKKDDLIPMKAEMLGVAVGSELFKVPHMTLERAKVLLKVFDQMIATGRIYLANAVRRYLRYLEDTKESRTIFQWKNLTKETACLLETIGKQKCDVMEVSNGDYDEYLSHVKDIVGIILEFHRKGKLLESILLPHVRCILGCISTNNPEKSKIAYDASAAKYLMLKSTNTDILTEILEHVNKYLEPGNVTMESYTRSTISHLLTAVIQSYNENSDGVTKRQHALFMTIFSKCCNGTSVVPLFYRQIDEDDYDEDNYERTVYLNIYRTELKSYLLVHLKSKTGSLCKPIIGEVLRWIKIASDEKHEDVLYISVSLLKTISIGFKDDLSYLIQDILDLFFATDISDLINLASSAYKLNPEIFHKRLPELINKMTKAEENDAISIGMIVEQIANKHAKAFNADQVGSILELSERSEPSKQSFYYHIIRHIAEQCPKTVRPHLSKIMDDKQSSADTFTFRMNVLGSIAYNDQTCCSRIIDYFMEKLSVSDPTVLQQILYQIMVLIEKNKEYFERYKDKIKSVGNKAKSPDIKNTCTNIINVLEGKSAESFLADMQQMKDDIAALDYKVVKTMTTVVSLGEHVIEQDKEIDQVKKDLDILDEKVEDVEEDLGVTKAKVEDIDNKTISSAPKWSKDLSRLLNTESDHDWRLLAKRLGYSNDDIKAWAQQHDPCMSMINEWYSTHKTSEATHGLLNNLTEMERLDAVVIVENAMKIVEGVVEDEEFEYASPPPIFISYQWGVQNEVKLLKQHLNMAGYECWMDIGQMGGGDNLFQKIDNGVRAAKVIICCTTEKYAKSPNCNREVNLSVNLGKPIIPLLMEKMAWPPKGSMGPIFSEYLFIRFFQRAGEETEDQRYWPVPKFQELLMQLNFFCPPDPSLLHSDYDKWWIPIQEEIKITTKTDSNKQTTSAVDNQTKADENTSPELFVSYQWGRQTQVKLLYDRLTGLGFSVWMDIFQMGGGDSLYDKIDRGIRGCKLLIACVTPKYALSANCRREISLADAIKKPIIPILLEEMRWPPDGPMSMVFTEVLYINMYRDPEIQKSWRGNKFDELLNKVQLHFPSDSRVPSDSEKRGDNNKTTEPEQKSNSTKANEKSGGNNRKTNEKSKSAGKTTEPSVKRPVNVTGAAKMSPDKKSKASERSEESKTNNTKTNEKPARKIRTFTEPPRPVSGASKITTDKKSKANERPGESNTNDTKTNVKSASKTRTVTEPSVKRPANVSGTAVMSPDKTSTNERSGEGIPHNTKTNDESASKTATKPAVRSPKNVTSPDTKSSAPKDSKSCVLL